MPNGVLPAWAKVNLTLRLVGRRGDGYHLLQSLVVRVALGDTLTLETAPADRLDLEIAGPFAAGLPGGPANLVIKAAEILRRRCRPTQGAAIALNKQLPHAAGLGGGSADAAAVLKGLNRLWELNLSDDALRDIAAPLGADLPVCLGDGPQIMEGIGELLRPFSGLPDFTVLLVNPGIELATADVFAARRGAFSTPLDLDSAPRDRDGFLTCLAAQGNDLQDPAIALCPGIAVVLSTIADCRGCRLARMSGSGASCFGLFDHAEAAAAAQRAIAGRHPDWWLASAPLIVD